MGENVNAFSAITRTARSVLYNRQTKDPSKKRLLRAFWLASCKQKQTGATKVSNE